MPRILSILLGLLLVAGSLSGCRSVAKPFQSAYPKAELERGAHRVATEADLRARAAENAEPSRELWAKMGTSVRRGDERALPGFTTIVIWRDPDLVKLGISRMELGTIFTLVILGEDVSLYANREGRMFRGSLDDLKEKTALIGGLSPRDLVTALRVQGGLADALAAGEGTTLVSPTKKGFLVARRDPATRRQFFWLVRGEDGLVEELLIRTPRGAEELRIRYQDFDLVENPESGSRTPWPTEMTIALAQGDLEVRADVREYRLVPNLPPGIEKLPKAREEYTLREMQLEMTP